MQPSERQEAVPEAAEEVESDLEAAEAAEEEQPKTYQPPAHLLLHV
jgi:hypothetical protein